MSSVQPIKTFSLPSNNPWQILRRCYSYWRPNRRIVGAAYALTLVVIGLTLTTPQFIRWTVDHAIGERNIQRLGLAVLGLIGLILVKGLLTYYKERWVEIASQTVAFDLRNELYTKLAYLSFAYHDQTQRGQLLSKAIQDVDRVRFLTGRVALRLAEGIVLLTGTVLILLWMNPRLALIALFTLPILVHRAIYYGNRSRPLSWEIQERLGVLTTRLEQNLRGARVVKSFAQEDAETRRFEQANTNWFDASVQNVRLTAVHLPLMDLIVNLGAVFILWLGGYFVIQNQLTLGELVAFTTYLTQLSGPIRTMGNVIAAVAQGAASGERVFDILDTVSEVRDGPDAIPLPPVKGQVRFEDVSFGYPQGGLVLDNISFEARPGQIIALLGMTGSGKSSIINLIPRFYDPTQGRITIDGYDLRTVTLNSLRDQIGMVLQESTLFAATIRENIAMGRPDASEVDIIEAAKAAQAHDFILGLEDGYDTEVGERGVTLSGGQKQRIAIARALLKDPRILILDDATSSVDTQTERLIQQALERLMAGRTSFVIAQRLSTVRMANLILVLDHGKIRVAGTHETLLQTSDFYRRLYERQLRPGLRTTSPPTPPLRREGRIAPFPDREGAGGRF